MTRLSIHADALTEIDKAAAFYDQQAHELDEFVYANRDMLICFAAGNDGRDKDGNGQVDPSSVTPPAMAR